MGAWDTSLKGNDMFQDIYTAFFDRYAEGQEVIDISFAIRNEFAEEFDDVDDGHQALFALALAEWETCSLSSEVSEEVKTIVENGKDLDVWRGLGADERTVKRRHAVLKKFLDQLSTKREKPRVRRRRRFDHKSVALINVFSPDGQKSVNVSEEYLNGVYTKTRGMLRWGLVSGSGILDYLDQGRPISAVWLDNATVEIRHGKESRLPARTQDHRFYRDVVKVIYWPI